jgi:putative ABC transport system permease protein
MSYLKLILKNPFRNKTRTSLAIFGIAIGITIIVAMGMVTNGLQSSTQSTINAGSAEITVTNGSSNSFSATGGTLSQSIVNDVKNVSGVKTAAGVLSMSNSSSNSTSGGPSSSPGGMGGLTIIGIESSQLSLAGVSSSDVNGSLFSNGSTDEVIIGKNEAKSLNKTVGDTINLYGKDFKITGIYETGNIMQDQNVFMPINTLQSLTNNTGRISSVYVKIADNANATTVSKAITNAYPGLSTTTAADQASRMNSITDTIDSASWAISLLAIFIGGVGVINTMIMSVFERTREIGVLKAVGWKDRRILGMIIGESIVLTLLAAIVGTIVGVIGVEVAFYLLGSTLTAVFSIDILIRAFGVALIVGVLGGLYPAYRASRLQPTEALRYE